MEPDYLKAIEFFKDWTNALLVTTVAVLGWIATEVERSPQSAKTWCMWLLVSSLVFGIFTLALIPIVAQHIPPRVAQPQRETSPVADHQNRLEQSQAKPPVSFTFYDVRAPFKPGWLWGPTWHLKIKTVCWPQHVLFLLGMIVFVACKPHKRGTAAP